MGHSPGLARIQSDPQATLRTRQALGRLSNPDLLTLAENAVYIDADGRLVLRLNGTTLSQDASGLRINPSGSPVIAGLTIMGLTGYLYATAGVVSVVTNLSTFVASSGVTTGNTAATETDLFKFPMPANLLSTNGECLEFTAGGTISATAAANKILRVKFGSTTIFDSLAFSASVATSWSVTGTVLRTGATTQRIIATIVTGARVMTVGGLTLSAKSSYATSSETLANALDLTVTGIGTNADDVVGNIWKVVKQHV